MSTIAFAGVLATVGVTGSAQSSEPISVTVPGCWGAGTNDTIVCDLVLSVYPAAPTVSTIYVKVCAGSCQDVPVPWVNPGTNDADLCWSYKNGWGTQSGGCAAPSIGTISIKPYILDLLSCENNGGLCAHE